jgi:hypothetical protein
MFENVDHTDASTYQPSDYSGVTTADLVEIYKALVAQPATLQVSAVLGRVRGALDRRSYHQRTEAFDAHNARAAAATDYPGN